MAKSLKYPVGTRVLTNPKNDCWEKEIPAGTIIAIIPKYRVVRWDRSGSHYSPKVVAILLSEIVPDTPLIRELATKYAMIAKELSFSNEAVHKKIRSNGRAFQREMLRALKQL